MAEQADVVIVGGGVNGASVAYHLAQRRYGNIVLLEKSGLASGSTGKSAGIIRQHYSNPTIIRMAIWSREFFERFEEKIGGHPGFVQNGFLLLVAEQETEALRANVAAQRALGLDVEIVQPDDLHAYVPGIDPEGVALAAYESTSGYADPYGVAVALAERARTLGVHVHLGRRATAVRVHNGRVQGVETDQGAIETPVVVNAAGPWGNALARSAGIALPLQVKRLQEIVVRPVEPYPKTHPTIIDLHRLVYFKPESGGLIVAGGGITDEPGPIDPDQYGEQADFETVADVTGRLACRIPALSHAAFIRGWAGVITVTPDFHPILGEAPEVGGFIHAMSCNGHGFKLAPAVGRLIAELIVDGRASMLDLAPFGPDRFEQGRPLSSRYAAFPILA